MRPIYLFVARFFYKNPGLGFLYILGMIGLGLFCWVLPHHALLRLSAWILKVDLPLIIMTTTAISIGLLLLYWKLQPLLFPPAPWEAEWFKAASDGNIEKITRMIAEGVNVNVRNRNDANSSALYDAVICGPEMVSVLLKANANVNICNNIGRTPLLLAATTGNDKVVQMLLDAKAHVIRDVEGNTPLMAAVSSGNLRTVEILLAADNSYILEANKFGKTAKMYAVEWGNPEIINILNEWESKNPRGSGEH